MKELDRLSSALAMSGINESIVRIGKRTRKYLIRFTDFIITTNYYEPSIATLGVHWSHQVFE